MECNSGAREEIVGEGLKDGFAKNHYMQVGNVQIIGLL